MSDPLPILLLAKQDRWCSDAEVLARILFGDRLLVARGRLGDPFPADQSALSQPRYGAILSFLSPWILPVSLLERADIALNFHPGSCDYPGIGCYNFALYEGAAQFGAVCHHMAAAVDTGPLVEERLFPVAMNDSVESLKFRTMVTILSMFHDISARLAFDMPLPVGHRHWTRRAFRRSELNALCQITPEMDAEEIARRVRATTYPGAPGPVIELAGIAFSSPVPRRDPLA